MVRFRIDEDYLTIGAVAILSTAITAVTVTAVAGFLHNAAHRAEYSKGYQAGYHAALNGKEKQTPPAMEKSLRQVLEQDTKK